MPLDLKELTNSIIFKVISPDNVIISNRFILAIVITLIVLLIFYLYSKNDIDTVYEDSNLHEIILKSAIVSSFVSYTLIFANNKVIENKIKSKYEQKEKNEILNDVINRSKENMSTILPTNE